MPGIASEAQQSPTIYNIIPDDDTTPRTTEHDDDNLEERPLKRRRVSEGTPTTITRKKPESPPWKKVIAEGPSSFTQGGIRKSGRTNPIPLELQPPSNKRQTRGANQKELSIKGKFSTGKPGRAPRSVSAQDQTATAGRNLRRPASSVKNEGHHAIKSPSKRSNKSPGLNDWSPTTVRSYKRAIVQKGPHNGISQGQVQKGRRSGRSSDISLLATTNGLRIPESADDVEHGSKVKVSRIRFRVKPPTLPTIHPDVVLRRTRLYPSFKDFLQQAEELPIEKGGLLAQDEDAKYTPEIARREARLLVRMEEAAENGGVLSPGVSSAYRPEELDREKRNTLRQYAHQDHLLRAVIGFRALMLDEHNKHKRGAKRLADACRDEWIRRQPKTAEEIEAEAIKVVEGRYKSVMRSLQMTWDNVKAEVNRRRLKEWEAEEQVRVRKALNQAVDISTRKLEARRLPRDSELLSDRLGTDISGSEDESSETEGDSDSNMSFSESDAEDERQLEVAEDEHLTVEELRQKYSGLPKPSNLDPDIAEESEVDGNDVSQAVPLYSREVAVVSLDEDSDESVNMEDDMGSSDAEFSSSDREDDREEDDSEDDHTGESNLLGFLAPSDLASIGVNQGTFIPSTTADEDDLDEEDEVSLIPDPTQLHMPSTSRKNIEVSNVDKEVDEEDHAINTREASPAFDHTGDFASGDRSSQPTPESGETKPSEVDSASSIDLQQGSHQLTHSTTPQPSTKLKTPIPFLLRGTLREYQHYGLDWLAGLYANNTNGILADEMGLGKTIQTIALLAHLACEHHVWGPHLVIVPTSVMLNWEMEFKKWCPGFKILTYYGTQEERRKKRMGWTNEDSWNVCITSYQLVLQDQQVFKRRRWHYLILDEAHNIKNFRSQRWQTLLTFNTRARLLLTGTPLQNNLTELWSLLFFLMPSDGTEPGIGGFADLKEFSDWFRKPQEQILENGRETMDEEARAIISKLHKVLRPYLLRRMKADVEKQMPAKYEHVEYCRLSRRQRELYDGFLSRSDTRGTLASGNYLSIINCLMQLRKVCNHPDLFQERPILSSFPMKKSAIAGYEIKDLLVRRRLLREEPMSTVSLEFLNLVPTRHEKLSGAITERSSMLTAQRVLMDMREAQRIRAQYALASMDPSTVKSNLAYLESAARWGRFEELQHCVYLNALRRQQKPIYGSQLVELLTLGIKERPFMKKPARRDRILDWIGASSAVLREMIPTLEQRSEAMQSAIQKFACITPPIIAPDILPLILTRRVTEYFQTTSKAERPDPFHEARMRLSVQFPDKRLLQYDCGKLQTLAKLLRKLESGGHRALIFTQMTKVLDILEQFLNIHGHRYLRLDGATKIEQRQILTDRFNNDNRILAFILSSRSGGLGINLTGADTVIFYDLDWNPAMDKQCQDRCHRIGQTRDVHIYRLVSEHTIEANILRKANQKRMLDDVVIQEGEFTTDYFNKMSVRDVLGDEAGLLDGDAAANAAMDRLLGGPGVGGDAEHVLEAAEDQEDVAAAKVAQQEIIQTDAADFDEKIGTAAVTPKTQGTDTPVEDLPTSGFGASPAPDAFLNGANIGDETNVDEDEANAWGAPITSTDDYMLKFMITQLKHTPLDLPKDKTKIKRGKDHIHRSQKVR